MKKSEIKFTVTLDEEKVPTSIEWEAGDAGMKGSKPCKAVMMSVWDPAETATLRIDLWTKEMMVDEMQRFFYETFMTMAETYQRATGDKNSVQDIKTMAEQFAKKTGLIS